MVHRPIMRLPVPFFLILSVFFSFASHAQDRVINTESFENYMTIHQKLMVWEPGREIFTPSEIDTSKFITPGVLMNEKNFFTRRLYLLELTHTGDEPVKTVYFFAGKMVDFGIYFHDSSKGWVPLRQREAFRAISLSSRIALAPLRLRQGTVQKFIIIPQLRYYNWEQWNPALAQPTAVNDLILHEFIQPNFTYSILAILMAGMMFMLFSYSFLKFYMNRQGIFV